MNTFDRYLLKQYLFTFVALFVTIFGLYVVIDGFSNIDAYQEGVSDSSAVLLRMARYYMYHSILFFDLIGSIVAVLAAIVVFAIMHKNREIHPLLAAGVPTYRILIPILIGTLLVTIGVIANQEILIPKYAHQFMQPRNSKLAQYRRVEPTYDRESKILVGGFAMSIGDQSIIRPSFVLPVPNVVSELTTINAEKATYHPATVKHPAGWLLQNVTTKYDEIKITESGRKYLIPGKTPEEIFVTTNVRFDQIFDRQSNSKRVSITTLLEHIRNPSTSHSSVSSQTITLHTRLLAPFKNIAVVFIALPLIIRRESRSLVTNLAICVAVMGVILGIIQIFDWLGKTNVIATDLAIGIPIILSATLAAWLTGYIQT